MSDRPIDVYLLEESPAVFLPWTPGVEIAAKLNLVYADKKMPRRVRRMRIRQLREQLMAYYEEKYGPVPEHLR